jgi:hypothetical protein
LVTLNETLANLKLQVNVEKPDNSVLEQSMALFSQNLESFLSPLVTVLQGNKSVVNSLVNTLQNIDLKTGRAVESSETPIQKISRELTTDKEKSTT